MRWVFFGCIKMSVFRQTGMETLFLHPTNHVINNLCYYWQKKLKRQLEVVGG